MSRSTRAVAGAGVVAIAASALALGGPTGQAAPAAPDFQLIGRYESDAVGDSAAEVVAYDDGRMFVVNAEQVRLDIVDVMSPAAPLTTVDLTQFGAGLNSVAVHDGIVAAAVEADPKTDPGVVVLLDTAGNVLGTVPVGALPDMVTFTPNGRTLLVANEGEPSDDYSIDPEGSVSVIDVRRALNGAPGAVRTAGFSGYNARRDDLEAGGVRIFPQGASVAQDLEPEYITVSGDSRRAWVTLQEANAVAVIDVTQARVTDILPLGYQDHAAPGKGLDPSDQDGVNIRNEDVLGMYMPDAIASFKVSGATYLVTANEGDARDPAEEEERARDLALDLNDNNVIDSSEPGWSAFRSGLGRLNVSAWMGDTDGDGLIEQLYSFGARSFSIWTTDGTQVYDSGDQFEQIMKNTVGVPFNANNIGVSVDNRSDNKGPEPEAVAVGKISGRQYAFVGLERIGGVMVFDVSKPTAPTFVQWINSRDYSAGVAGDSGPEVVVFVSADESPTGRPVLLVSNEISGTVAIYQA